MTVTSRAHVAASERREPAARRSALGLVPRESGLWRWLRPWASKGQNTRASQGGSRPLARDCRHGDWDGATLLLEMRQRADPQLLADSREQRIVDQSNFTFNNDGNSGLGMHPNMKDFAQPPNSAEQRAKTELHFTTVFEQQKALNEAKRIRMEQAEAEERRIEEEQAAAAARRIEEQGKLSDIEIAALDQSSSRSSPMPPFMDSHQRDISLRNREEMVELREFLLNLEYDRVDTHRQLNDLEHDYNKACIRIASTHHVEMINQLRGEEVAYREATDELNERLLANAKEINALEAKIRDSRKAIGLQYRARYGDGQPKTQNSIASSPHYSSSDTSETSPSEVTDQPNATSAVEQLRFSPSHPPQIPPRSAHRAVATTNTTQTARPQTARAVHYTRASVALSLQLNRIASNTSPTPPSHADTSDSSTRTPPAQSTPPTPSRPRSPRTNQPSETPALSDFLMNTTPPSQHRTSVLSTTDMTPQANARPAHRHVPIETLDTGTHATDVDNDAINRQAMRYLEQHYAEAENRRRAAGLPTRDQKLALEAGRPFQEQRERERPRSRKGLGGKGGRGLFGRWGA